MFGVKDHLCSWLWLSFQLAEENVRCLIKNRKLHLKIANITRLKNPSQDFTVICFVPSY